MKSKFYKDNFWILAKDYLNHHLPVIRKCTETTIDTYRQSMKNWLFFLKSQFSIERQEVTFECFTNKKLTSYVQWMNSVMNYSPATVNLRITVLTSFLEYACNKDESLIPYHKVICDISRLKITKKPIEYLESDVMNAILSCTPGDTRIHRRNRMIVILMYETGCRVCELPPLTLKSLHIDGVDCPYITIMGKGRKIRNVPLSAKAVEHLKVFIREFHRSGGDDPLFYSRKNHKNEPLSTDTYQNVLKQAKAYAEEAGHKIPAEISVHLLRKTRAMDLYQSGVDLFMIAQFLGHEDVNTTNGFYAFASFEMISKAMKKIEESNSLSTQGKKWKEAVESDMQEFLYSLS